MRHDEAWAAATPRWLRAAVLASASLLALALAQPAKAQDATWLANPGSGDFNTGTNWTPATTPIGTAFFGASNTTSLSFSSFNTTVGGFTFNAGASNYTFNLNLRPLTFTGAGIDVQGGRVAFNVQGGSQVSFNGGSTAGIANIAINFGGVDFHDTSTAGNASITANSLAPINFYDASTAGSATITNNNSFGTGIVFAGTSTAANSAITNAPSGNIAFQNGSTAGSATLTNNGTVKFIDSASGGSARMIARTGGVFDFSGLATAGTTAGSIEGAGMFSLGGKTLTVGSNNLSTLVSGVIADGGAVAGTGGALVKTGNGTLTLTGSNSYTGGTTISGGTLNIGDATRTGTILGAVTVTGNGSLDFVNADTSGITNVANNGSTTFHNSTNAGGIAITQSTSGQIQFNDTSSAGGATIINTGTSQLFFGSSSTAGNATISFSGSALTFSGTSSAGSAHIANNTFMAFQLNATAGNAVITNTGGAELDFLANTTAGNATIINSGLVNFFHLSSGGNARLVANAGGVFDFAQASSGATAGSIEGAGRFNLEGKAVTVGGNNLSTTVSGVVADGGSAGGTGGALVKTGTGALTLSGINSYTGATTVNAGALVVDGSIAASSSVTVNSGGVLAGTGTVGKTTINNGGTLWAGGVNAGTSLNIAGSLALQSGAFYMVQIDPATSSFANVTGTATLGGATVKANFAGGNYVAKQYTILTAGNVSGTFGSVAETNLPSNFHTTLSYDAAHAYLNLVLNFVPPPGSGLSGNQQSVGNAIINSFNRQSGISLAYSALNAAGLTQASGESAAGSQQTTFDAMGQFLGLITDPFTAGRESGASGRPAYTEEEAASAYTARTTRDAYAMFTKAPPARSWDPRWNVWAAGLGGSQTTGGNTAAGSNTTTSRIFGMAAGADYWFSPKTVAGFALAGGGTNFSVANGGTGRSDLFQAGAFVRHTEGAAYLSGALAYGWQDVTTDRTVTIAGVDHLRAEFNANAWSGRLEGGYRFVTPWVGGLGLTPYAAAQFTTFDLPAYAEQVVSGVNTFALAYGSKSATDTRSEIGLRADKAFAMQTAILTLRGRVAWAHDFNPDRAIGATFQALPGASFVVNGARQASDSALTTASAEMKWLNGWSAAATFEGEFSNVTRSYAGKGALRYAW